MKCIIQGYILCKILSSGGMAAGKKRRFMGNKKEWKQGKKLISKVWGNNRNLSICLQINKSIYRDKLSITDGYSGR